MKSWVQKVNRHGHSDGERDKEKLRREEERRENKIRVQQSVAHEAAYGLPSDNPYHDDFRRPAAPRPQGQSRESQPSKPRHRIRRKPQAPRDDSYSQQNEMTRPRTQRRPESISLRDEFSSRPSELIIPSDGSYSKPIGKSRLGGGLDSLQPKALSFRGKSSAREFKTISPRVELNLRRPEKMQPRDEFYSQRVGARRPSELDQDSDFDQAEKQKSSSSTGDKLWLQDTDSKAGNRGVLPKGFSSSKDALNPSVLPRVLETSDISNDRQSLMSSGIESCESMKEDNDSNDVVERIRRQLHKAKLDYPSEIFKNDIPKHCSLEDIEKALHNLIRAYGFEYQSAYESKHELSTRTTEYATLKTSFDNDWVKWTNLTDDLEAKVSALTEEARRERERTSFLREEHAIKEKKREAIAVDNEIQIKRLEGEAEQAKSKYESEISQLKKIQQQELTTLEITTEQLVSTTIRDCDGRLNDLIKELEAEKRQLASHHQESYAELERRFQEEKTVLENGFQTAQDQYQIQFGEMQRKHKLEIAEKNEEIEKIERGQKSDTERMMELHKAETDRINKLHKAEMDRVKQLHEYEKKELEDKREEDHRRLRNNVVALTEALVSRDHFKPMSDHDLARRFQNIASEANEFARVPWDNRRESTWPFTESVLRNSENERRTKQYVVQNTIWVVLYEGIFCSPFQIFGSKGKSLVQDWIKQYGQDRKSSGALALSPKPTKDSEKWRYETMKRCLDDIGQPSLEQMPNHNLKQDYELALRAVIDEICYELERVASISGNDKQRMSDFVRKAAQLWLEAGQQRYRVFLLMSNTGENPSRSGFDSLSNDGSQDLVVTPELRRLGNAQGERLERDELVRDCKGKFSMTRTR